MQYRFLSSHTIWLPRTPDLDASESAELFINEILIPRLASVGGIQAFAKSCSEKNMIQCVTYSNDNEKQMSEQLQNQLTADGYPKDIIALLNMCEIDSVNATLQRFINQDEDIRLRNDNNWLPMGKEYNLKLKTSLNGSDFQHIGFDPYSKRTTKQDKNVGYIRWLPNLPRLEDGTVDIGEHTHLAFILLL